jgi:hypothetical protein
MQKLQVIPSTGSTSIFEDRYFIINWLQAQPVAKTKSDQRFAVNHKLQVDYFSTLPQM